MSQRMILGKGFDSLFFEYLDSKYDEPEIHYQREGLFKGKKSQLEEYEINRLIKLLISYLKAKIVYKDTERKDLKKQLKDLEKEKEEVKSKLNTP
ncbi:hypothetical protein LCGC14_0569850 [marine sediment metagenome]|uniref:Uncharacterized protein n=1 Tax=marine sediment metagenome TaxID=412755 RepID=A0A0F9USR0_9ZZZZ